MRKILAFSFLFTLLVSTSQPVLAAGLIPCGGNPRCCDNGEAEGHLDCVTDDPDNPSDCEFRCQFCDIFVMLQRVINFILFTIVPPLAVLLIVAGGALFIFGSSFDPGLISQGRAIIQSVAIGLVIVYGAWIFVNTFFVFIGLANSDLGQKIGDWFQINCHP